MSDIDRAVSALLAIDPGCPRDQWIKVGMAAKCAGVSFDVFLAWSSNAGNFDGESDCRTAWRSFSDDGGVTAASLFYFAQNNGWNGAPENCNLPVMPRPLCKANNVPVSVAAVWADCIPASEHMPYIQGKNGDVADLRSYPSSASPLRIRGENVSDWLAVPCWDGEQLQTIQFIGPDGRKLNLPGAKFNSGYFTLGLLNDAQVVYVVEGIGQAWAVRRATGAAAVVCFGIGRMNEVVKALLSTRPGLKLVLVPDRGQEAHAQEVALASTCQLVDMPDEKPKNYDVNDFAKDHGDAALCQLLNAPRTPSCDVTLTSNGDAEKYSSPPLPKVDARDGTENTRPLTEYGNALRLLDHHGAKLRYVFDVRLWLVWDQGAWVGDDGSGVRSMAMSLADDIYREGIGYLSEADLFVKWARKSQELKTVHAAVSMLQDLAQVRLAHLQVDADKMVVGFNRATQLIDLRTGVVRQARPEDYVTKSLAPTSMGRPEAAETWLQFLDQVFAGDLQLIDWVQRFCGYLLTGSTQEQIFLFCYGHGANGKSVFIETLKFILGDYARAIAPETLTESRRHAGGATPDLVSLIGARLVVSNETEDNAALAESLVKALVSGDSMVARPLYSAPIQFAPIFKLVMAGNHKPVVRGNDHGIWRRMRMLPFNVTFSEGQRDSTLLEKLKAEAPDILAWMAAGAAAWSKLGLADTPDSIQQATDQYKDDQDLIKQWLDERTIKAPTVETSSAELYASYKDWCIENGQIASSKTTLGRRLGEREFKQRKSDGNRFWRGIALRDGCRADIQDYRREKYGS